jgi:hypothetical protein
MKEGKYYVFTPPAHWEGPFDTEEGALSHIRLFVNEQCTYSPEMLKMAVVICKNNEIDLVKRDGVILNGEWLHWRLWPCNG